MTPSSSQSSNKVLLHYWRSLRWAIGHARAILSPYLSLPDNQQTERQVTIGSHSLSICCPISTRNGISMTSTLQFQLQNVESLQLRHQVIYSSISDRRDSNTGNPAPSSAPTTTTSVKKAPPWPNTLFACGLSAAPVKSLRQTTPAYAMHRCENNELKSSALPANRSVRRASSLHHRVEHRITTDGFVTQLLRCAPHCDDCQVLGLDCVHCILVM